MVKDVWCIASHVGRWNTILMFDRPTGDIIYTRMLCQEVIILSSEEVPLICLKSVPESTLIASRPPPQIWVLCHPEPLSAHSCRQVYDKPVRRGMGDYFRAVWAEIQITPTTVTSGLSCSSSIDLSSKTNGECVPDVDPAVGRPNTL